MTNESTYAAFVGMNLIASGPLSEVLPAVKHHFDGDAGAPILVFENETGRQVDFDLRGTVAEVLSRAVPDRPRSGPGRPKLGVISREVSLLPRHWEWLEQQPNGASAAIRRLVEQARKQEPAEQHARQSIDAASRFLTAMAGDFPGYEEATRALYARDRGRFEALVSPWPHAVRQYALRLVEDAL